MLCRVHPLHPFLLPLHPFLLLPLPLHLPHRGASQIRAEHFLCAGELPAPVAYSHTSPLAEELAGALAGVLAGVLAALAEELAVLAGVEEGQVHVEEVLAEVVAWRNEPTVAHGDPGREGGRGEGEG